MSTGVIGRTQIVNQQVNPVVSDYVIQELYDNTVFAPQFFGKDAPAVTDPMRPKIMDFSSQINRPYTRGETIKVAKIPNYNPQNWNDSDELNLQNDAFETVSLTITISKVIAVAFSDWQDPFVNINDFKLQNLKSQLQAIAQSYDDSVIPVLNTFTQTIGGGAADTLDFNECARIEKHFFDQGIDSAQEPVYMLSNSAQYAYLQSTRNEYQLTGVPKSGNTGRILETPSGIRVCRSNRIPEAGGVALTAAFTTKGIMTAFAIKPAVTRFRDERKMAEVQAVYFCAGVAKLDDQHGVKLAYNANPTY